MGLPERKSPPVVAATEGPKAQSGDHQLSDKNSTGRTAGDYCRERYRMHGAIRRLLTANARKLWPGKFPSDVYRTTACTWTRVSALSLIKPAGRDTYHYKGLTTCGSVWVCPLCASKIQERRRQEVAAAILHRADLGLVPFMVSLTFPHRVDQPLAVLLERQREALSYMRGRRGYIEAMRTARSRGRIRSLEVTHGQNGWHPHTHELLFLDPRTDPDWLRLTLSSLWLTACRRAGLFLDGRDNESDFLRHSVDVQVGDKAVGNYLAKLDDQSRWGVSHELTKASSKQGRRSGVHPFRLADSPTTSHLFCEYVDAMKGARQLVWSRGLKAEVGIADRTDEELAQDDSAVAVDVVPISPAAWRVVLGNDARWELTEAARAAGADGVRKLLQLLGYSDDSPPADVPTPALAPVRLPGASASAAPLALVGHVPHAARHPHSPVLPAPPGSLAACPPPASGY